MRLENTWHEIRDHSFIQNHSRSSDTQLLLFSSLTHLLQGSGQRTPDTRSETIPSSRITPDLQIHSFSSSVHLTHLLQGSGQRTPDTRSETIPSSRITADPLDSQLLLFSSPHSSSTGIRSENTWHEIRDHSFIQNHSRSSDSQLLLFSSLTHLLQGSGQRTPDTRSETIPSSRITADPLDSQLLLFSSPHSSSTGIRSENTWHEIRDHSFIQNHSRSSYSQLLLFSSLTHLLQGSGQRTPDTRSETIPSSRITPDPSDSQLLLFSSLTHLLQGSGQRTPDTRSETIPSSRITPDLQIHSFSSSVHLTHLLQGSDQRTPDKRSETIPSSRITPDPSDSQLLLFSSPHSSSTGIRSENTWHEIRDHSFIQNHSRPFRFTASPLQFTHLLQGSGQRTPDTRSETIPSSRITPDLQIHIFSSVHLTHLLQGSGQRTPDTRSETIPSSRITPDLQIHSFSSSVHLTHLLQGSGQRTPDTRSETIPSSRITPDLQIHSFSSSVHLTHPLQGSDQRTPDTRSETIPSSRITPDLQIHSFSSSVHSLIFYRVQVREHLTRDQRSFLHPESLQIFRFTASPLQFTHSSSTGFRSENTWHEIRDHSFIQNHSRPFRFTASPLQFTSLIFYRVQVRGLEWPAEAWFCA